MPDRKAKAVWEGDLQQGRGTMRLGSGAYEGTYSFKTRMGDTPGTNPEELIGAALAGCYSMALANGLTGEAQAPKRVETDATVHFEKGEGGWSILRIDLLTEVEVAGIDEERFRAIAEETKSSCPVSKALTGTEIRLEARLLSGATR